MASPIAKACNDCKSMTATDQAVGRRNAGWRIATSAALAVAAAVVAYLAITFDGTSGTGVDDEQTPLDSTLLEPSLPPPDFAAIDDVAALKTQFRQYLIVFVDAENQRIRAQRDAVLAIQRNLHTGVAGPDDRRQLADLATEYDVAVGEPLATAAALLRRVDVLPADLVLAQGAIESGWGRSRFAVDANNFFGMRCFSAGCGLVPSQREPDASYEVRRFASPQASVAAYMHTLNTYPGYAELRHRRAALREAGKTVAGLDLAEALAAYSTRREDYVAQVKTMLLQFNALATAYDGGAQRASPTATPSTGT